MRHCIAVSVLLSFSVSAFAGSNVLVMGSGAGVAGSHNNVVSVWLKNDVLVRGVQLQIMDIPDYLMPDSIWTTSRTGGFIADFYDVNSYMNLVLISFHSAIQPDSGSILEIGYSVSAEAPVGQELDLLISNIIVTDVENKPLEVSFQNGTFSVVEHSDVEFTQDHPRSYHLAQNYPNPFSTVGGSMAGRTSATSIGFTTKQPGHAVLAVYDILGRHVRTLVDATVSAGNHRIGWDGFDDLGNPVPAGVYLYRLTAGDFVATKRLLLTR